MRPPMVANPFPEQKHPWVHRCGSCGSRMAENIDNRGIHCPVCHPKPYDALRDDDAS